MCKISMKSIGIFDLFMFFQQPLENDTVKWMSPPQFTKPQFIADQNARFVSDAVTIFVQIISARRNNLISTKIV